MVGTMNKYAEMSDDELNRLVAERQGWRETVIDATLYSKLTNPAGWEMGSPCLIDPQSNIYSVDIRENADDLWTYLFENEVFPARDNNAAAALDFGARFVTIVRYPDGRVEVSTVQPLPFPDAELRVEAPTMARAITIAWLVYQDALGGQG